MWARLEKREIDRRGLRVTAGDRPRPDLPPGSDLIPEIKHIVVLMMENHSYDNYLGMLTGRGDGFTLGPDGAPTEASSLPDGQRFPAHHFPSTAQTSHDPTQNWHASHIQYGTGDNDGFAASVAATVPGGDPGTPMGYWTAADLPFYYGLARTFPVADRWFCSCLGPTFPNRRFLIAGTAHGLIHDLPWDLVDYPEAGTVFDLLSRNDISWVNYHNVNQASVVLKRLLGTPGLVVLRRLASVGRWLPGVADSVRGNKSFTADLYPLGLARCMRHLRHTQQFFTDAAAGSLPAVSIVDPDFELYSEENPQDISHGESFAAAVVNAVMHGPAWESTLLLWIYDEHGGYYDHVPPPAAVPPDDVPARNWQLSLPSWVRTLLRPVLGKALDSLENVDAGPSTYDRLGFRVPAVVVSPYARPGHVMHENLDHTSVLRLIEDKWNLPPLTRRDAAATSPLGALDLSAAPAFRVPPDLPAPKAGPFHPS
ncbi:MAG TPA: alkaline phosphatase family protein [Trebonia sp.]|nr:alkaline phosphatase family protein [Trebonia sp.]